jgi:hypothetical protein
MRHEEQPGWFRAVGLQLGGMPQSSFEDAVQDSPELAPAAPVPSAADEGSSGPQILRLSAAEIALDEVGDRLQKIIETQRDVAALDLDLQATMNLICERTQNLTAADGATILLLDGEEFVHRAGTGFISSNVGQRLGLEGTFSGSVYRSKKSAICHDTRTLADPSARQRGIGSIVAVPLHHGRRPSV